MSEQLKDVTSSVLNGMPVKKLRLEKPDTADLKCTDVAKQEDIEPVCPSGVAKDDPPQLPAMNFGGAKNFTVNINYGK